MFDIIVLFHEVNLNQAVVLGQNILLYRGVHDQLSDWKVPRPHGCKTSTNHDSPTNVLDSWHEIFLPSCRVRSSPNVVLCFMAGHLHFDLLCAKDIVPEVLWFLQIKFANLSGAAMFFLRKRLVWPGGEFPGMSTLGKISNCLKCFPLVNFFFLRLKNYGFKLFGNGIINLSRMMGSNRCFSIIFDVFNPVNSPECTRSQLLIISLFHKNKHN